MDIVSTLDIETRAVLHHMSVKHGNYGTLCGVSIDDDMYDLAEPPANGKVNCKDCVAIWQKAKEYRLSDIDKNLK